ncbi:hypothetical protein ACHAO9_010726 [Fusarium lateritium]
MSLPIARIISVAFAALFLAAIALKTFFPGDDPYRCRALKDTGRWIDPPRDEEGNRNPFQKWQPDGCMLNHYASNDIRRCMEGRRITIVGDSTSRYVAHGFSRLIDETRSDLDRDHEKMPKYRGFNMTYHGQMIQRLPNVWLSPHGAPGQQQFAQNLEAFLGEKQNPPSIIDQEGPALLYIAAGVSFNNEHSLRSELKSNVTNNTAIVSWEKRFKIYKDRLTKIASFVKEHTPNVDVFTTPMDPIDGIGNQIFYAPPTVPLYLGNESERMEDSHRRQAEVFDMHDWLHDVEEDWRLPFVWSISKLAVGQKKVWIDPNATELHVKRQIADTRANILLNLRCNAKLDRMRSYPYSRTCCTDYGTKPMSQLGFVFLGIIYLGLCIIFEVLDICGSSSSSKSRQNLFNMKVGFLVLALLMCYYADRTQMIAKGSKLRSPMEFIGLCIPCIAITLITIRRSPSAPRNLDATIKASDQPFLSRHQTDEWKGWMQFFILIYHWTGTMENTTFFFIRVCVAAYLFQTGYGHTLYFLKRGDFSFNRVAAVLLRLNILTCLLVYFMDTDYMFYYFAPLVSFWFLVVYTTMAVGAKKYNNDPQMVVAKICLSCVLVSTVFWATPFTKWAFRLLRLVFNIQWSDGEWQYRVRLDIFVVHVGMLAAVINNEMKKKLLHSGLAKVLAMAGVFAIGHYFRATAHLNQTEYKTWHPFMSFVPVLAFIALRNFCSQVRNHHSMAMAWLGRCSLELYILQFHLLLAGDSNGILIVDGLFGDGSLFGDRWRTLVLVVPIFLWVCSSVAESTSHVVSLIMTEVSDGEDYQKLGAVEKEKVRGSAYLTGPKVRVAGILGIMWLLNLATPGHLLPLPQDGSHAISSFPSQPADIPY